jgi:4-hydroxybenzoate polyprenyltransferase
MGVVMHKIKIFFQLTVPEYLIITFFSFFSAYFLFNQIIFSASSVLTFISLSLGVLALNSFNQVFDFSIDKINKPKRPIVSDRISKKNALLLACIMFLGSLLISFLVDYILFLLVLSFVIISIIYSMPPIRLKKLPLSGMFVGTYLHGVIPFFSAVVISNYTNPLYTMVFGLFFILLAFSSSPIKDLEDIKGDKNAGLVSLPLMMGEERAKLTVSLLFSFTGVYLLISILLNILPMKFLYSLVAYVIILLVIFYMLFRYKYKKEVTQSKFLTLIMFLIAIIEVLIVINSKLIL